MLNLYSKDISSVGAASELFGRDKGLLVVRPARFVRPWFSVPEGCYALVTRFGKDLDHSSGSPVWPAGFHYGLPWTKVSNLVSKQSVVFNMPVKGEHAHREPRRHHGSEGAAGYGRLSRE
jgi:hypothetical protein